MDRHRGGDRYTHNNGGNGAGDSYNGRRSSRFSDGTSRFYDDPPRFFDGPMNRYSENGNYARRSPNNYRGGADHRPFESPPPPRGGGGGLRPLGGGGGGGPGPGPGFRPIGGGGGGFGSNYPEPLPPFPNHPPLSGQKRAFGRRSPDRFETGSFAKLFVGSVPRTATEADIRPLFEDHGKVIEVALIRDKRTGQQQGCCFIKYATSEEADRAIKALHNQYTLPGGVGPIQVRYADGERERLGAVEFKLFVGSLNKQASEKEVEEIFLPYGRVEDVYLMRDEMKQSRGCGFVKFSHRDMALAAINALNGIYTMRGCDQPLTVRFADPKRPRPGDSRGAPAFGGAGFGPRFQAPAPRPPPNFGDPTGDRIPPNAWHSMSPKNLGPTNNNGVHGFGTQLPPRSGDLAVPSNQQGLHLVQQISPLHKPFQSPQHLPPSQLYSQALASQHTPCISGSLSTTQPQLAQSMSSNAAAQAPANINLPSHSLPSVPNIQQLPSSMQQHLLQSHQQSPSQLAQMLSQQTQTLQASFQSSQQAFSQLQQQLQMMQPPTQNLPLHQSSQVTKPQWPGVAPQTIAGNPTTTLPADVPPTSAPPTAVMSQAVTPKCNWTEHFSPEGFKYYYNSVTCESRWEKPEDLTSQEQQQSQQQLLQKPSVQQYQTLSNPQVVPTLQVPLQAQLQTQFHHQQQLQQPSYSSLEHGYAQLPAPSVSINDPTCFQASQESMWKNKPAGT
ncbi:hypothetical protein K2173_017363 [Erythroxylum novogranatense]|uniref:Flowering time control protein FCA n=1 Tax=Erythroxylum novogranatense TaxID=1862640 RepID=A0AAV8TMF6_9ROSI|nr:hypothetical protein K2173_017363 [Erythroxylum novogranatense]